MYILKHLFCINNNVTIAILDAVEELAKTSRGISGAIASASSAASSSSSSASTLNQSLFTAQSQESSASAYNGTPAPGAVSDRFSYDG